MDPRALALHSHPVGDNCGQEGKDLPIISQKETGESLDALIALLEEEDGKDPDPEVLTVTVAPGTREPIPPAILATDPTQGLNDTQVMDARRKFGMNQMKPENKNHFAKFWKLFLGPVQFVMEVCILTSRFNAFDFRHRSPIGVLGLSASCCRSEGLDRFRCDLWAPVAQRCRWVCPGVPRW